MSSSRISRDQLVTIVPLAREFVKNRQSLLDYLVTAIGDERHVEDCMREIRTAILFSNTDAISEVHKPPLRLEISLKEAKQKHLATPEDKELRSLYFNFSAQFEAAKASGAYQNACRHRNRQLKGLTNADVVAAIEEYHSSKDAAASEVEVHLDTSPACLHQDLLETRVALPLDGSTSSSNEVSAAAFTGSISNRTAAASADSSCNPVVAPVHQQSHDSRPTLVEKLPTAAMLTRLFKLKEKNKDWDEKELKQQFILSEKARMKSLHNKQKRAKAKEDEEDDGDDEDTRRRQMVKRSRLMTESLSWANIYFVLFGPISNHWKFGMTQNTMSERSRHYTPSEGPLHMVWRVRIMAGDNSKNIARMLEGNISNLLITFLQLKCILKQCVCANKI